MERINVHFSTSMYVFYLLDECVSKRFRALLERTRGEEAIHKRNAHFSSVEGLTAHIDFCALFRAFRHRQMPIKNRKSSSEIINGGNQ